MNTFHNPVLLNEVISYLNIQKGAEYIDATVGSGGHTLAILQRGGLVLGIDRDQEAIDYLKSIFRDKYAGRIELIKGNFKDIQKIALENKFLIVKGILFDLGVSSYQLDNTRRGFSYSSEARLDMRMDKDLKTSAYDLVNNESEQRLQEIFLKFGEEPLANPIARAIIRFRTKNEIISTKQLADIIKDVYQRNKFKIKGNPAARIFQALRIEVNQELTALNEGLSGAISLLSYGGRLAVISYHSLEDRIVKLTFIKKEMKLITKKPVLANEEEVRLNRRARSAKLRVAEKL